MTLAGYRSAVTEADHYSIGGLRGDAVEQQQRHGWQARSDSEPWLIPDPIDWSADPFGDPNWYAQFHGWRPMDPHLRAFLRTQDSSYLRNVVPWVVAWPRYRRDAPKGRWKTLDALGGMRATRLALIIDAHLRGDLELADAERVALFGLARDTAAHLMTPEGIQPMNHGYFQVMGLELLGRVMATEDWAAAARDRAFEAFNNLIALQFTEEGVHVENSPSYHWYSIDQLARSSALETMASDETVALIERARAVWPWLTFPDGAVTELGDSAGGTGSPMTDAEDNVVRLGERSYALAPFWRSGYAIIRSLPETPLPKSSMLVMVGMAHTHTHSHADKLSFELFEFGRRLIVDPGYYGYVRDPTREYIETAVAHNTVGLADQPILRTEVALDGTRLFEPLVRADAIVLSGEVVWKRRLQFTHRRELIYRPGRSLVVRDSVAAAEPRSFVSRLHFDRSLDVRQEASALVADLGDGRTMRLTTSDGEVTVHRGETNPMRGWKTVGYLEVAPTTMAEVTCPGRERHIEWHITF